VGWLGGGTCLTSCPVDAVDAVDGAPLTAVSVFQRSWQRGANSESSLKLYKKDSGGAYHSVSSVRGVGADRGARGGGRGMGGPRGGPGGLFFDRQRSTVEDEPVEGTASGSGRGRGEDGRTFGRGE
jgi:hypothetical protein